jgi:membrane protease YdiL (CAAX protease family)
VIALESLVLLASGLGWDLESLRGRYGLLGLQFAGFMVVPWLFVSLAGGRPRDLGMRPAPLPAVGVAVLCAPLFIAAMLGYSLTLHALLPDLALHLHEETAAQAEILHAPWPLMVLVSVLVGPVAEEILFRGFLYGGLRTRLGPRSAGIVSAILFALCHGMLLAAPIIFFLGLGLARAYEWRRSLALPYALHASFNLASLLLQQGS